MDFKMSTQTYAIRAVNLLRAAGHENACHVERPDAIGDHIISVDTDAPRSASEAIRLVRYVDPDAEQVR